jgi:non-heme chloroperoxidase
MSIITTNDGTKIAYKDWGKGQPMLFSHGWPLTGDAWEARCCSLFWCGEQCFRTMAS